MRGDGLVRGLQRAGPRATTIGLGLTFALVSLDKFAVWALTGHLGVDLRIYREATRVALEGGNPWSVMVDGYYFAAPPTSLLPFVPAAFLPVEGATVIYGVVMVAAAVFAVRALKLPSWWIFFPPLFESVLSMNTDVLVLAALASGSALAGTSVVFKVYGAIPLVIQRRWAAVVVAGLLCAASLPWWPEYIENRGVVATSLESQAGNLSAWGTWLMVPAVVALVVLRKRGAEWLIVPALWPYTQLHYSTIAAPAAARSRLLAFLLSFGIPLLPPIAVIVEALRVLAMERFGRRSVAPGEER